MISFLSKHQTKFFYGGIFVLSVVALINIINGQSTVFSYGYLVATIMFTLSLIGQFKKSKGSKGELK